MLLGTVSSKHISFPYRQSSTHRICCDTMWLTLLADSKFRATLIDVTMCLTPSVVLALCVLWRCMCGVHSGCEFPDYMQTNGTARDWVSRVKQQNTEVTLEINVSGGAMTTVSTDSTASSYSRLCLRVGATNQDQFEEKFICPNGNNIFVRMATTFVRMATTYFIQKPWIYKYSILLNKNNQ